MGESSSSSSSDLSGKIVFEPILEEGVFRLDCSPEDRAKAFPSISFAQPKAREALITTYKVPEFVPEFTCDHGGRQTVYDAGKAEGVIFEDDGDGYGYTQADYLLTN